MLGTLRILALYDIHGNLDASLIEPVEAIVVTRMFEERAKSGERRIPARLDQMPAGVLSALRGRHLPSGPVCATAACPR